MNHEDLSQIAKATHEEDYAIIECRECHHVFLSLAPLRAREFTGREPHREAQCDFCGQADGKILRTGVLRVGGPAPL